MGNIIKNLPKNWKVSSLQELLETNIILSHLDGNHGGLYPRKEEFIDSGVPYISANCINGDSISLEKAKYLSLERAKQFKKGVAINRDVLFAHNATVGPVALLETNEEFIILGTSLTYYRCNEKFLKPEYLKHYLNSQIFKNQYLEVMGQATRNQVPITKQRTFYHVIPPLPEQKRIVAKLDGLFAKIDQAIGLLEENMAHTQALMGSVLDVEFGKLKDKFKNLALEEVLKIKSGDFLSSKKMSNTNEYNVYGGNGVNGTHNLFNLEGENIIIGRVGAKCGNVRLVNESIWVTDNAFYVSEIKKDISKEFLLEILRLLKLGDTANQAAQPVISFKGIRNLVMPIPDRKSQKEFCLKSQGLRMKKNKLIETQTQKLTHLKALKSSLLDQAFKGEL